MCGNCSTYTSCDCGIAGNQCACSDTIPSYCYVCMHDPIETGVSKEEQRDPTDCSVAGCACSAWQGDNQGACTRAGCGHSYQSHTG
jgi:hypothetical protein